MRSYKTSDLRNFSGWTNRDWYCTLNDFQIAYPSWQVQINILLYFIIADRVFIIFAKRVTTVLWKKELWQSTSSIWVVILLWVYFYSRFFQRPLVFFTFLSISFCLSACSFVFLLASFVISDLELMLPSSFPLLYTKTIKSAS